MPVKVDHSDAGQVQLTPRWLLDLLGPIALDPCTEPDNPTRAACWLTGSRDSRRLPWRRCTHPGELIFVNPPFGDIPIWARKLATETKAARCRGALLVPTGRSERMWFQNACRRATYLWLPHQRVHYEKRGRARSSCPFPSCLFLFGRWPKAQLERFGDYGVVLRLQCVERWS